MLVHRHFQKNIFKHFSDIHARRPLARFLFCKNILHKIIESELCQQFIKQLRRFECLRLRNICQILPVNTVNTG